MKSTSKIRIFQKVIILPLVIMVMLITGLVSSGVFNCKKENLFASTTNDAFLYYLWSQTLKEQVADGNTFSANKVETITFTNDANDIIAGATGINITADSDASTKVSTTKTDVIAYVSSNYKDVVIYSEKQICETNSFIGFTAFEKLKSINFKNYSLKYPAGISKMFYHCSELESVDFTNVIFSTPNTLKEMFSGCTSLQSVTFGSNFNTEEVSDMSNMFSNCRSLTSLNLSMFNSASLLKTNNMFSYCYGLQSVTFGSNFAVTNLSSATKMFYNCTSLKSLNLGMCNFSKVSSAENFLSETTLNQIVCPVNVAVNISVNLYNASTKEFCEFIPNVSSSVTLKKGYTVTAYSAENVNIQQENGYSLGDGYAKKVVLFDEHNIALPVATSLANGYMVKWYNAEADGQEITSMDSLTDNVELYARLVLAPKQPNFFLDNLTLIIIVAGIIVAISVIIIAISIARKNKKHKRTRNVNLDNFNNAKLNETYNETSNTMFKNNMKPINNINNADKIVNESSSVNKNNQLNSEKPKSVLPRPAIKPKSLDK